MSRETLHLCTFPSCSTILPRGQRGRCERHPLPAAPDFSTFSKPEQDRARYRAEWHRMSARVRREEPYCVMCGAASEVVDHIVAFRDGGDSSRENLQALCTRCHARKTRAEFRGRRQVSRIMGESHA